MTGVFLKVKELMGGMQGCQTAGALSSGSGGMCIDQPVINAGVFRLVICSNVHMRGIVGSSVIVISIIIGSIILFVGIVSLGCSTSVNCLRDQQNARRLQ